MNLRKKFRDLYSSDEEQLKTIFTHESKIIVEGPAGYGKTKTMIGKIAYIISSKNLLQPKKILTLTFSVNAAYKIKKKIAIELPEILCIREFSTNDLNNKVYATNYHGFCRRVLELYGYLLHPSLSKINSLKCIDDNKPEDLINLKIGIKYLDAEQLTNYNKAIKEINKDYINLHYKSYLKLIKEYLLSNNYITYNSIILLTLEIFKEYPDILNFYHKYFSHIIVDEFQDTNILSWELLKILVTDDKNLIFMGDPLQRIYGFIGAIPELMEKAENQYNMEKIILKTNHRFKNNKFLCQLDENIRKIAKEPHTSIIEDKLKLKIFEAEDQFEEANFIINIIEKKINNKDNSSISILVNARSNNIERILEVFNENKLLYFYALFSEEDSEYLDFHNIALHTFLRIIKEENNIINKKISNKFYKELTEKIQHNQCNTFDSLKVLLRALLRTIFKEYNFLQMKEKINLIKDILENNSLKQYLGYIDENLIVSTIHGAKGLEWDYVILPDMEQYSFPNWLSLCEICNFKRDCNINWTLINNDNEFEKKYFDVLNVFYVACTRAKKGVFFSYSKKRIKYNGRERECNMSCLLKMKGFNVELYKGVI